MATCPRALAEALGKLVGWGNLRADPDTARVTTVEDFHRARFLYQLTHAGEAAERALGVYEEQLGKRGALQAVALADIATQLRALRELAGEADPDPARLGLLLRGLVDRSEDLANNAQAFMGSLRRTIELHDADVDAYRAYKGPSDRLAESAGGSNYQLVMARAKPPVRRRCRRGAGRRRVRW